jgi:hypothetical protein
MESAGLLANAKGIAVHDCWKPYWHYTDITHALCNAPILRELNYFEELTGQHCSMALRQVLVDGKKAVASARAESLARIFPGSVTRRDATIFARFQNISPLTPSILPLHVYNEKLLFRRKSLFNYLSRTKGESP